MAMEIERKWLLPNGLPRGNHHNRYNYETVYLSTGVPEVRVRKRTGFPGTSYRMCVKGDGLLSRVEIEEDVSESFYNEVVKLLDKKPIIKDIYYYFGNNKEIVVSIVDGDWAYAEVEFKNEKDAAEYVLPWEDAIEVTNDPEYKMKNYWKRTRG